MDVYSVGSLNVTDGLSEGQISTETGQGGTAPSVHCPEESCLLTSSVGYLLHPSSTRPRELAGCRVIYSCRMLLPVGKPLAESWLHSAGLRCEGLQRGAGKEGRVSCHLTTECPHGHEEEAETLDSEP